MKTRFFAFAALALTLAACNNDNEILNNDGPVAARFTAAIGNNVTATPSTRVSGTDGDLWDNGDCIGITGAGYTNIPYVTSGDGNFTPKSVPIYYNDPSEHAFSAYYPYQEDSKLTEDKITVTTDAEAQQIRTQGIANINTDGSVMHDAEPVSFSSVIGMPVACIPLLGYVNSFVTSTVGTFVVVAGAVVAVALSVFAGRSKGRPVPASKHMRQ